MAFKPGQSGNPGGVHKKVRALMLLCRESMPDAIAYADRLFRDENATHKERMEAVKFLAAYGIGAPPKLVEERDGDEADPVSLLTVEELRALARRPLSSEMTMTAPPAPGGTNSTEH